MVHTFGKWKMQVDYPGVIIISSALGAVNLTPLEDSGEVGFSTSVGLPYKSPHDSGLVFSVPM